ncbi:hypothetical protein A2783_04160 [Microgenomates group bacterium RIFCSPHIGHO2_01_FULL_45_11]|nr:MAG: hypothetical protein A2783_04160 [Microgenomates group bacterium RIFCSPHIGHO2_01_FULL_45_11]
MNISSSSFQPKFKKRLGYIRSLYQKPIVKVSTALLLTIFTIIFFAIFAIRPTLTTIAQLLRKIEDQGTIKSKLDQKVAALATAHAEYLTIEPQLPLIDTAIPQEAELGLLARQIEGTASSLGIALQKVTLESLLPSSITAPSTKFSEIPVMVETTAPYETLQEFLNRLLKLPRVSSVEIVSLTKEGVETTVNPPVNIKIRVKTFFLPQTLNSSNQKTPNQTTVDNL